jgi:hypothetical protein
MKKVKVREPDPDLPDEIDFDSPEARRTGVRGKYAKRYAEGTNLVLIEPELRKVFPTAEAVNRALRAMAEVIRASSAKPEKRRTG